MAVTHVMTSCNVPQQEARTAFSWFTPSALSLSMAGPKSSQHDRVSTGSLQFFSLSDLANYEITLFLFTVPLLRQTDRFPNTRPRAPVCNNRKEPCSVIRSTFLLAGERRPISRSLKLRLLPRRIYKSGDFCAAASA